MTHWTTDEIRFLRNHASHLTIKQLASILDRPYTTVYYQLHKYGITAKKRTYTAWTARQISQLIEMRLEGRGFNDIGKVLGRSAENCRNTWQRNRQ